MSDTGFTNPETFYKNDIKEYENQLSRLNKKHMFMGGTKLVLIFIGIIAILRLFKFNISISLGILSGCILMFIVSAFIHETILRQIRHLKTLITINKNELAFLTHQFPKDTNWGEEFRNSDHPYISDLDIFKEKGIFHFINRAVTAMGRKCLAERLSKPLPSEEILNQQEAVQELAAKTSLRHNAAAHGLNMEDSSKRLEALYTFLKEPYILLKKKALTVFIFLWPVLTVAAAVAIAFNLPWLVLVGFALVQACINKKFAKEVKAIYTLTGKSHKILESYSHIMEEIEKESFQSRALQDLSQRLSGHQEKQGKKRASQCIGKLSTLLEWFDTRKSMIHFLLNNTLFWDLHCVLRIEKWRKHTAQWVEQWFYTIGEFEAISSLATLRFNHPRWPMPDILSGPFQLSAQKAGHLLIPPDERVSNDFQLISGENHHHHGSLMIVTGPNMAGKSTFLRTVGVNIVLALAGAPVCAERFKLSPVHLFSSMQSSDSLDKHMSLFYAELSRLKNIIDGIEAGEPVFFLIDEMLKGTNALDRQKGAIALIKQLIKNKANGIVATHDLELTRLTAVNTHFDGYVEGDKLLFDYLLKPGTCQSFNALALMKKMGIHV